MPILLENPPPLPNCTRMSTPLLPLLLHCSLCIPPGLMAQGTSGFTQDGTISWTDPDASWVTGKVNSQNYKWIRFATSTAITTAPTVLGMSQSGLKGGASYF